MPEIRTGKLCLYCGNEIIRKRLHGGTTKGRDGKDRPNDSLKYCSQVCAARDCGNNGGRPKGSKDKEPRPRTIWPKCKIEYNKCIICSKDFISNRIRLLCNDRECKRKYSKLQSEIRRKEEWQPNEYKCKECNKLYKPLHNGRNKFCSIKCNNKYNRRIRSKMERARKRKNGFEKVNPIHVFERDKWNCQLCHMKTLKSKRGTTNMRAPELDHIIPLSRGGPHTYANVQCTCRKCNIAKSNKIKGQLRIC